MALPQDTLWDIEPHSEAKHKILKRYLEAWFPIICRYNKTVNYIDGFAGPGRYSNGEPGSPLIALNVAISQHDKITNQINFLFIEENKNRADHLKHEIERLEIPDNFKYNIVNDRFHSKTMGLLNYLDTERKILVPTFAFIDPFGFSGIPFTIIKRLLSISKVEVFITFMVDSINRFVVDSKVGVHINELFDDDKISESILKSVNRSKDLKTLYQSKLKENARYVRYFEMCDNNGKTIYYLFFATNHELGHIRMKEAMWSVDEEGFYKFSDETDPNQTVLFSKDFEEDILVLLKSKFGNNKVDAKLLQAYINNETPYLGKHLSATLRFAEEQNLIEVGSTKTDGKKRKKRTFPDGTVLKIK